MPPLFLKYSTRSSSHVTLARTMAGALSVHIVVTQLLLVLIVSSLPGIEGHRKFVDQIPNAGVVPNPYYNLSGTVGPNSPEPQFWGAIGHLAPGGGGRRNQFGIDFDSHKQTWSREFCQLDSDQDGRSNGVELGDPLCTWKQGQTPDNVTGITHPGICEPINSPICQAALFGVPANQPSSASAVNETSFHNLTASLPTLFQRPEGRDHTTATPGRANQPNEESATTERTFRTKTPPSGENPGIGAGSGAGASAGAGANAGASASAGTGVDASAGSSSGSVSGISAGADASASERSRGSGRLPKTKAQQLLTATETTTASNTTTTSATPHLRSV